MLINYEKLRKVTQEILVKAGFPGEDAWDIADSLVEADCNGVTTHGLARLNLYIERAENNALNRNPQVTVVKDNKATLLLDADDGMGIVAAKKAIEIAVDRAKEYGISIAGIKNSNHLGALSYVTGLIQQKGMIGFACSNTSPIMAPHGGREPIMGNNPFSVAIPTDPPIIFDTALSVIARGNIILAEREGKSIPEGWAVNNKGQITTDAKEALLGAVLPMAKHKGYGMALLVEILSGVLTGAQYGTNLGSFIPPDYSKPLGFGHLIVVIDSESFMEKESFTERVNDFILMIKNSQLAEGFSEILVPGEIERRKKEKALNEGLSLAPSTVEIMKGLCRKYGLEADLF